MTVWDELDDLAANTPEPTRFYGGNGTIHRTGHLDIEVDPKGNVVAVWFRCMLLPFEEHRVDWTRTTEMRQAYKKHPGLPIHGIEVEDNT